MQTISDKFIVDFLHDVPFNKVQLLERAILKDFEVVINDGITVTEDWEDTFEIYLKLLTLICKNLYDIQDDFGFPKARAFAGLEFIGKGITNKEIVLKYVQARLKY